MRIYYLDAPLGEKELEQLRTAVCRGPAANRLHQVRIPFVLPADEPAVTRSTARHLQRLAARHLEYAGAKEDIGRQVGWVLPQNPRWGEIFQEAIHRITGFYPVAIQRWRSKGDGTLERVPLCVMDAHRMSPGHSAPYAPNLIKTRKATSKRDPATRSA